MAKLFIFVFSFLLTTKYVIASLTINEIYPAPAAGDPEWVELYNNSSDSADLTQYLLTDLVNNKIKINEATLSASSYFIASCSSILNNSGDTVFLKKIAGEIVEIATYSGSFASDKSYAKCSRDNWITTDVITKNFSNETACLPPTPTLEPTNVPVPTEEPISATPVSTSYENIFLSEVYSYPPTGENEWVEIYNNNDFLVELTNWYLDDIENSGSSPKTFSLMISAKSYAVFDIASSMFNNSADHVRLLDSNKNLKDNFEYVDGEKDRSWGRQSFNVDEFCLQKPTKNTVNETCLNSSSSISSQPTRIATQSITNPSTPRTSPLRASQPIIISTPAPTVLGEKINISIPKSSQKPLTKALSFIAFSNSLLTIGSILLKIKVHEVVRLFS